MNEMSVVNIIADQYKGLINELAESLGKGKDSLSVKLQDEFGNIFWGCHSWWNREDLIVFNSPTILKNLGVDIEYFKDGFDNLHEYVIDTLNITNDELWAVPRNNWDSALIQLGLTQTVDQQ